MGYLKKELVFPPRRQDTFVLLSRMEEEDFESGGRGKKVKFVITHPTLSDSHIRPFDVKKKAGGFFCVWSRYQAGPHSFDRKNEGDFFGSSAGSWIAAPAGTEFTKKVNVWNAFFPFRKIPRNWSWKMFFSCRNRNTACCSSSSKSIFFLESDRFWTLLWPDPFVVGIFGPSKNHYTYVGIEPSRNIFFSDCCTHTGDSPTNSWAKVGNKFRHKNAKIPLFRLSSESPPRGIFFPQIYWRMCAHTLTPPPRKRSHVRKSLYLYFF